MSELGDPYRKAASNRSAFEEILSVIPGFQGYLKKEHRRSADRLQRDYLVRLLDQARERVRAAQETWTDGNRFAHLEQGEKAQNELQRVASRVKNADLGESGFFATVKIGERELATLYEVDRQLLDQVDAIGKACEALDPEGEDAAIKKQLKEIQKATGELDQAFSRRKDMITGVA